ncbi:MAG: hypothetical protein WA908_07365 [Pontixanthobacter sp.]
MPFTKRTVLFFWATLPLAGCGVSTPTVWAIQNASNGEWCAVADKSAAKLASRAPQYRADQDAVIHFRESVLAWIEYTQRSDDGRIKDTYTFDKDWNVTSLTRTGRFDNELKLYVRYERSGKGRMTPTDKARSGIDAHAAAGYSTDWIAAPVYQQFSAMPFADTVRTRSMGRSIKTAC